MEVNPSFSWKKEKTRHNSPLLPDSIRGLICGSSNCGKTTLILNLLINPGWLDYNHLFVFGKSLHQKEYQVLRKALEVGLSKEQLANLFKNQELIKSPIEVIDEYISDGGEAKGGIQAEFFDDCKLIPDPGTLNDQEKNLMIFDDCILEKQSKAQSYYTRGRHSSCDSFYISQNYFKLDRQTIRENSNLIILFPQNPKSLAHIHSDHCGEISFQDFKDFCNRVWSEKYNFVTLDLTNTERKYRKNFDQFFNPKEMSFESDKVAKQYDDLVKKIKQRNENAKTQSVHRQMDLNETFRPVIQATQEQTAQLKASLKPPPKEAWDGSLALDFYYNHYPKNKLDDNYGLRMNDNDELVIGDQPVKIEGNNIIINDKEYVGTPNLWALIMQKNPSLVEMDKDTLQEYKRLITDADVEEYVANNYEGDYRKLTKTKILNKEGRGITFLPSDIDSLNQHLRLLLGEFKAGNRATQNQIVAILDNLLERKKISKREVKEITNFLQNAGD